MNNFVPDSNVDEVAGLISSSSMSHLSSCEKPAL